MRIWNEELIPKLCRQHLLAVWREGLGAYKIITENKKGYRNHPAVKEFRHNKGELTNRLIHIRVEMKKRGYNPKPYPWHKGKRTYCSWNENGQEHGYYLDEAISTSVVINTEHAYTPWQTLEEQIAVLKRKGCDCNI